MELAALALVNLLTAIGMYFVFALRFSRAVEKTRKNEVFKELRENVEMTVEYINTALDMMDQKTRTFYQLVRRQEELLRQLENQAENGRKTGRKRKKAAGTAKNEPPAAETPSSTKSNRTKQQGERPGANTSKPKIAPVDEVSDSPRVREQAARQVAALRAKPPGSDADDYDIQRVLGNMESDMLELSPGPESGQAVYDQGRLLTTEFRDSGSHNLPRTVASADSSGDAELAPPGWLGRIGSLLRRTLGMPSTANRSAIALDGRRATAASGPAGSRSGVQFQIPMIGTGGNESRQSGSQRRTDEYIPSDAYLIEESDSLELEAIHPDENLNAKNNAQNSIREQPATEAYHPAHRSAEPTANHARSTRELYQPVFAYPGSTSDPHSESELLTEEFARKLSQGGRADRAMLIRTLLRSGYPAEDISAGTGIALAEVELVASLPEIGRRPRRNRLTEQ